MSQPPAREYNPADVPWRLRDQVQLRAVLGPLTGGYTSRAEVPAKALAVRRRWRWTAARLARRGWAPLAGSPDRRRMARDCPMTFLLVRGRPRPCRLRTACPFCWARQAAEWWDAIDDAFFRDADPVDPEAGPRVDRRPGRVVELDDGPAPAGLGRRARARDYILVTRSFSYPIFPRGVGPDGARVDLLRDFYLARLRDRGVHFPRPPGWRARNPEVPDQLRAVRRPGARAGCFENITADLSARRDVWWAGVRQVWLVPAGSALPAVTPAGGVLYNELVTDRPWRTDVMKAVARACRYPRAMLAKWRGGGPALQLVTARAGLRLAANYGDFRRSHRSPGT